MAQIYHSIRVTHTWTFSVNCLKLTLNCFLQEIALPPRWHHKDFILIFKVVFFMLNLHFQFFDFILTSNDPSTPKSQASFARKPPPLATVCSTSTAIVAACIAYSFCAGAVGKRSCVHARDDGAADGFLENKSVLRFALCLGSRWSGARMSFPWRAVISTGGAIVADALLFFFSFFWYCEWFYNHDHVFPLKLPQCQEFTIGR